MSSGQDADEVLTIDRLVAGGDGFCRTAEGLACFVPGSFPGDRIRPRKADRRRSMWRVTDFEIVEPSGHRVQAPCPHNEACGGCSWMGLSRAEQRRWKGLVLQECLRRQGKIEVEVGPAKVAGPDLGYRHRVRFQRAGDRVGFFARGTRQLVEIDACAVAHPAINAAIAETGGELRVRDGHAGVGLTQRLELPGAWIDVPPRAFSQVNPHVNRALVEAVLEGANGCRSAFDLHCGAGNFALPLAAAGLAVRGCDVGTDGVRAARASAEKQDLDVDFFDGTAEEAMERWTDRPDLVVLDPPRAGCRELVAPLLQLRPTSIAYVSCDPATCARDVGQLVQGGYILRSAEAWDMFPHTPHVEALVWLDAP